ncbi:glucosyltransferase [Deltaproteobacteria bacterium]|nr:glucosyltransferase [Deltaproteobacteria bacterium]
MANRAALLSVRAPMNVLSLLYASLVLCLCAHGAHRWVHVWRVLRHRSRPVELPASEEAFPFVTVQLPVYNERDVVARLIDSVAALDWPRDRFEVQLLDDSSDDTAAAAAAAIARARMSGVNVSVITRRDRRGFKAGALAHGLERARGELVAIFDADFTPQPSFLRDLIPHFSASDVGMVQARWGHLNAEASWLTRAQARMLDAHFSVEHFGRNRAGLWFNFNGTAGIWRKSCIHAAGGWQGDTLTEDLDLSYRAQMAGWRFVYRDDVEVPAELPETIPSFLAQQRRWAKGSVETLLKLGRRVLRSAAPLSVRAEALHHLTGNLAWPLALLVAILLPAVVTLPGEPIGRSLLLGVPAFLAATLSHAAFFALPARARLRDVPLAVILGIGLAVSQTGAVFEALAGRRSAFVRTPKQGGGAGSYTAEAPAPWPVELGLAAWQFVGITMELAHGRWQAIPFLCLFAAGFAWVGAGQIWERRAGAPAVEAEIAAK